MVAVSFTCAPVAAEVGDNLRFDCAAWSHGAAASLVPAPGTFTLQVRDMATERNPEALKKLKVAACRSSLGAQQAYAAQGDAAKWIADFQFVLLDTAQGLAAQAAFDEKEWKENGGPLQMQVGVGVLARYSDAGQIWVFGHEFRHKGTVLNQLAHLIAAVLAAAGGFIATCRASEVRWRLAALLICAAGTYHFLQGDSRSEAGELAADVFGVSVLENLGWSRRDAKAVAIEVLSLGPEPQKLLVNETVKQFDVNAHPPTKKRILAIEALN